MYVDHRTATTIQNRRVAELRRMAAQQRIVESLDADPKPAPSPAAWRVLVARFLPRHA